MQNVVNKLITKAEQSQTLSENDYINGDGLRVCGKCHTPKQCKVEFYGIEKTVPCICKCEKEKREAEEAARKQAEFMQRVKKLRSVGFPESDMQAWSFSNDDEQNETLTKAARNYVEKFDEFKRQGKGLLLFGSVGTGKTFAAACIANALIDKGVPVLMTNFSRIANTVQGMYEGKQAYYDSLNKYPLLILDDLAAERNTEFMNEIVYSVIDSRYRAKLPLIVTSNLTGQELKNPSDITNQRTFSRLLEMCYPLEVNGKDRRREKLKNHFEETKSLLGL